MRCSIPRPLAFAFLLLACGRETESQPATARAPVTPAVAEPARTPAAPGATEREEVAAAGEVPPIDTAPFIGRWRYAADPSGAISFDPVFEDSTITLGADGSYAFALGGGGSMGPLEGTWEVTGGEGDAIRYRADFGEGRVTDEVTLRLRREAGEVVGLVMSESVSRYYVRDSE